MREGARGRHPELHVVVLPHARQATGAGVCGARAVWGRDAAVYAAPAAAGVDGGPRRRRRAPAGSPRRPAVACVGVRASVRRHAAQLHDAACAGDGGAHQAPVAHGRGHVSVRSAAGHARRAVPGAGAVLVGPPVVVRRRASNRAQHAAVCRNRHEVQQPQRHETGQQSRRRTGAAHVAAPRHRRPGTRRAAASQRAVVFLAPAVHPQAAAVAQIRPQSCPVFPRPAGRGVDATDVVCRRAVVFGHGGVV